MQPKSKQITNLKQAQQGIIKGIQYLSLLNESYKTKQEKSFLNTFLHVMDKMSNELRSAHDHYDNIDKQIEKDEKCLLLKQQLNFFKTQCLQLKKQLDFVNSEMSKEKQKSAMLNNSTKFVSQALKKKISSIQKYRSMTPHEVGEANQSIKVRRQGKSIDGRASLFERTTISKDETLIHDNQKKGSRYDKKVIRQQRPSRFSSAMKVKFDQKSQLFEFSPAKFQTVELRNNTKSMRYGYLSGTVR